MCSKSTGFHAVTRFYGVLYQVQFMEWLLRRAHMLKQYSFSITETSLVAVQGPQDFACRNASRDWIKQPGLLERAHVLMSGEQDIPASTCYLKLISRALLEYCLSTEGGAMLSFTHSCASMCSNCRVCIRFSSQKVSTCRNVCLGASFNQVCCVAHALFGLKQMRFVSVPEFGYLRFLWLVVLVYCSLAQACTMNFLSSSASSDTVAC